MSLNHTLRQLLPIVVSAAIVAFAGARAATHAAPDQVRRRARGAARRSRWPIVVSALLGRALYTALAIYETIVARSSRAARARGGAVLAALLAAPIGHAIGWGAVSGGAIRYRIYSAVHLPPLDIGKIVLLAAIPVPGGARPRARPVARAAERARAARCCTCPPALARGTGLALLALHAAYLRADRDAARAAGVRPLPADAAAAGR